MFGYGFDCAYPVSPVMPGCACSSPMMTGPAYHRPGCGTGRGFSLIVVLFILLIIIGASYCK